MSVTCETWMPVSSKFKTYPLDVEVRDWDGPVYWSKGHHDRAEFVGAVLLLYEEEYGDDPDRMEFVNRRILCARPRWEWWAVRQRGDGEEPPGRGMYWYEWVNSWARGAFPVTVIDG